MNWSRTKTIFIFTFLFLNFFLGWQLLEKYNANQLSMITEATIQDRLKDNNITINVDLPEEGRTGVHIVGKYIDFSEDEVQDLPNQQVQLLQDDTMIVSLLDEPYPLSENEDEMREELSRFLVTYVIEGSKYQIGSLDSSADQFFSVSNL